MKATQWPKLQVFQVPLKNKDGTVSDQPLAFLLPHELLFNLSKQSEGCLQVLQETQGLDETCLAHVNKLKADWGEDVIPISLWHDGVPFNWDRSDSLEMYSLALPGLASTAERVLRFPLTVVAHQLCTKTTHQRIFEILAWSFTAMACGQWPTQGPGGSMYRHSRSSQPLGYVAALAEFKGDWKMMAEVVGLPSWQTKAGVCWRCNTTKEQANEVGLASAWRLPQNRISHGDLMLMLQRKGPLCRMFNFPGFHSKLFRTANLFGGILHMAVSMPKYGANQEARLSTLCKDLWSWYASVKIPSNRLSRLPLKRFKQSKKRPCLKASGGQIRTLVPWFVKLVRDWSLEDFKPNARAEAAEVKEATENLAICYQCLSSTSGFEAPMEVLQKHSIVFAEAMVRLVHLNGQRFFLPPKLHLWLELPSTSRTTLQSFMVKQPLPTLKGVQVGNPAAGSGGQSSSSPPS